jgi:hypothetical protein
MSRFLNVLGKSFLVQNLYGSRYAPHIGTFALPVVYIKAMLYSASADQVNSAERKYVQGFIDVIFPSGDQQEYENKIALQQIAHAYQTSTPSAVPVATTSSQPGSAVSLAKKPKAESVTSFLSGSMLTNPVLARILLYDSIRTAAEDGSYTHVEQENAAKISKQLGISEAVTNRIEAIAAAEVRLANRKRDLLLLGKTEKRPAGHSEPA